MHIIPLTVQKINWPALHQQCTRRLDDKQMHPDHPAAMLSVVNGLDNIPDAYALGKLKHVFVGFRIMTDFGEAASLDEFIILGGLDATRIDAESVLVTGRLHDFMSAVLAACYMDHGKLTHAGMRFYVELVKMHPQFFGNYTRIEKNDHFILRIRC